LSRSDEGNPDEKCKDAYLQIYSIDEDEKLTPSLEIILPRDLADGFVNNKRESYRFK